MAARPAKPFAVNRVLDWSTTTARMIAQPMTIHS
jgi:hypothetical protein